MKPALQFKFFLSATQSWQDMFVEARDFARTLDPRQLVSISHSCDKSQGVVTVWFWDRVP